jgi:hypothetical protein
MARKSGISPAKPAKSKSPGSFVSSLSSLDDVMKKFAKLYNREEKGWLPLKKETSQNKKHGWALGNGSYRSVDDVRRVLPPGLYTLDVEDGHKVYSPVTAPADEAVDLPGLPSKYLMDQIRLFWSRADRYEKYHLLQKRGVLLYGEPGCGKTSIISLLSRDLIKIGGVIFLIDDFDTANICIQHFRQIEPSRPIMTVMEDIEGTFSGDQGNREVKAALSLLDGQNQVNNITHLATTNQPELLADRFIKRPGRFDLVIGIHAPEAETRAAYLKYVTQDQISEEDLKHLVDKTEGLSLAYLREIASTYLCLDIPVDETLERLQKNFKLKTLKKNSTRLGFSIGYDEGKKE